MWFDQEAGGVVVIGVTAGAGQSFKQDVAAFIPPGNPVRFEVVPESLQEYEELTKRLDAALLAHRPEGGRT